MGYWYTLVGLGKLGSPVINGKEPNHEGHEVHKGGEEGDLAGGAWGVTVMSLMVKMTSR